MAPPAGAPAAGAFRWLPMQGVLAQCRPEPRAPATEVDLSHALLPPICHPFWLQEDAPEQVLACVAPLELELRQTRDRLDVALEHVTQLTVAAQRADADRKAAANEAALDKIAELERLLRRYAPNNAELELEALEKRLAAKAKQREAADAYARPRRDA